MTKFGSSYPPGCSGVPDDHVPDPHPESQRIHDLLVGLGVPLTHIDDVCGVIDTMAAADAECPQCIDTDFQSMLKGESVTTPPHAQTAFPVLDKMHACKERSQVIGEFLDWLFNERGGVVCSYDEPHDLFVPLGMSVQKLLAEYFDIDLDEAEREKQLILGAFRSQPESGE